ncbi:MAG: chromosome partitioning protein ParB [Rickettsiales bacterium]|nr:chromosome partitioning protein ParB [Rickettsiales bacterium]
MVEDTKKKTTKPKALGRGLDALFGAEKADIIEKTSDNTVLNQENNKNDVLGSSAKKLNISKLKPGSAQPRKLFNDEEIAELASSIKQHGLIQPILVRPTSSKDEFEIIAGERRWRAAQKAGLHDVPVIIREMDDIEALEIGLIENLQRSDLSPIEEAEAYQRLMDEYGHSQEKLANSLGKSRPYVANILRLLNLPDAVRTMAHEGKLSVGHARALLSAKDPVSLAKKVVNENLSVRSIEQLVKKEKEPESKSVSKAGKIKVADDNSGTELAGPKDTNIVALERDLQRQLGMNVSINHQATGKGSITFNYSNLDQLDEILSKLSSL